FSSFHPSLPTQSLHSFPTRRSSDLNLRPPVYRLRPPALVAGGLGVRDHRRRDPHPIGVLVECRTGAGESQGCRPALAEGHRGERDRKSTRLNSSHVAISYAVFCLKK